MWLHAPILLLMAAKLASGDDSCDAPLRPFPAEAVQTERYTLATPIDLSGKSLVECADACRLRPGCHHYKHHKSTAQCQLATGNTGLDKEVLADGWTAGEILPTNWKTAHYDGKLVKGMKCKKGSGIVLSPLPQQLCGEGSKVVRHLRNLCSGKTECRGLTYRGLQLKLRKQLESRNAKLQYTCFAPTVEVAAVPVPAACPEQRSNDTCADMHCRFDRLRQAAVTHLRLKGMPSMQFAVADLNTSVLVSGHRSQEANPTAVVLSLISNVVDRVKYFKGPAPKRIVLWTEFSLDEYGQSWVGRLARLMNGMAKWTNTELVVGFFRYNGQVNPLVDWVWSRFGPSVCRMEVTMVPQTAVPTRVA